MGAELFHADGQTDMTKLIVVFRYFANAPKNAKAIYATKTVIINAFKNIFHLHCT